MSLDFSGDVGFRHNLRDARHLTNDRLTLAATVGYLTIDNLLKRLGNGCSASSNRRLTGDLILYRCSSRLSLLIYRHKHKKGRQMI
jgi:hypothetical protein